MDYVEGPWKQIVSIAGVIPIHHTFIDVVGDHCLAIQKIDDEHHSTKVLVAGTESYNEVSGVDGWYDALMVKANPAASAALKENGTLYYTGGPLGKDCVWENVIQFSHGEKFLGVKQDGTVLNDPESQDSLKSGWTDIVQVSTNWGFEVGVTKDGNVLVTGSPYLGSFDEATSWGGVVQVDTGEYEIIALHGTGDVSIDGYCRSYLKLNPENFGALSGNLDEDGPVTIKHCNLARKWEGIAQVVAGNEMVAGLTHGGMVEISGELDILFNKDWQDIDEGDVEIEVSGENNIVSCKISNLTGVSELAMEQEVLAGIKTDGTAFHYNGPSAVESWSNLKVRG